MDLRYWLNPTVFAEGSPGRAAAIGFVKARYSNDIKRLNSAWGCRAASFDALSDCVSPAAHRWQCQRSGDTGWPPGVDSAQLTSDSEAFILVFAKKSGPLNYRTAAALFFLGHISPIFAPFFLVFSRFSPS